MSRPSGPESDEVRGMPGGDGRAAADSADGATASAPPPPRTNSLPLGGPRLRRLVRERPLYLPESARRAAEGGVFAGIALLLLVYFRPGLLFSTTTTTGGDTGAHIYTPWYLKTHLLPRGLIAGWSPGWYGGFPILHFYFPFVVAVQALLAYVIPYEIAFKLGTVLGTFFFPISVYIFFRLLRFSFPTPIVAAVLSLGFLFMDSFQIYGGNIPSSLAGEYSFSFSLGMHFVFLGLAYRIATGDDGRPLLAAGVLAIAALSHLIPVSMVVLTSPLLLFFSMRTHGARRGLFRLGAVFALAFALSAFWSVPFLARLQYSADMHWFPLEGWGPLFPREVWVYLAGAVLAAIVAALRRDPRMLLFLVPAVLGFALYFIVSPGGLFEGKVWNGRFIPFWYLGAVLSTAYFVGTMIPMLARSIHRRHAGMTGLAIVVAVAAVTGVTILRDKEPSYIDNWIEDNYRGYEAKEGYATFRALMDGIEDLPTARIMWEPSPDLVKFGTPIALMSIPYWTGQRTMEGIYFESSMTTPFHFLTAAEVAERPSNPIPLLPYHGFDMARGLRHMEILGVTHFLSFSERARRAASETAGLERIADIEEFSLFEVEGAAEVVVPAFEPVVLEGGDWIEANLEWFSAEGELDVPLVREGPEEWARVSSFAAPLPRRPVENGGVAIPAEVGEDEVTFTTDAIGQPHWVKTSYFPNWQVDGALGPYLASPSMMVVVPTQSEVRLHYERTWAEWSGLALTLAALAVFAVPGVRRRFLKRTR